MQNLITFNDIPQLMVDVLAKLKELDEKMDRLAPSVKVLMSLSGSTCPL